MAAICIIASTFLIARGAGAQVAYVPVDGSPDSVLDGSSVGAQGSTFAQDCGAFPFAVPEGAVAWQFVLSGTDPAAPENVFDSVTVEFQNAGAVTVSPGQSAVADVTTSTDDVLLGGYADGSESAGDGFPATFALTATCFTPVPPPPPPPPPPPDSTTTTTTTVATTLPPVTAPPRRPPPPPTTVHHPAPTHRPSAPGHAPTVTAAKPPTRTQILWSAAALPLPFAASPLAITKSTQPTTTLASLMLASAAKPVAAAPHRAVAPHHEPTTTTSRRHGSTPSTELRGSAASVTTSTSTRSGLSPLLMDVLIGDVLLGAAAAVGALRTIARRRNPRTRFQ